MLFGLTWIIEEQHPKKSHQHFIFVSCACITWRIFMKFLLGLVPLIKFGIDILNQRGVWCYVHFKKFVRYERRNIIIIFMRFSLF